MKCMLSLLAGSFLLVLLGCASQERPGNPEGWSEQQVTKWFEQKEWLGQTELQPDSSIDAKEFAVRYHQNKDHWDTAFSFLREADLSALEAGTHELDDQDVFVIVSEYTSKNPEDIPYEAHKDYADIHYVVAGREYIGSAELSAASVRTPYDEERDIAYYDAENGRHLFAHPDRVFIFFPGELHSPGRKVEDSVPVKKIVVKVKS